jgi:hypothetical protein
MPTLMEGKSRFGEYTPGSDGPETSKEKQKSKLDQSKFKELLDFLETRSYPVRRLKAETQTTPEDRRTMAEGWTVVARSYSDEKLILYVDSGNQKKWQENQAMLARAVAEEIKKRGLDT